MSCSNPPLPVQRSPRPPQSRPVRRCREAAAHSLQTSLPHSGSAGCVRSVPGGIRIKPRNSPNKGWRDETGSALRAGGVPISAESEKPEGFGDRFTRRNTSLPPFMSTRSVRYPALSHVFVITLLEALLLHHARYLWDLGSLAPITRSICTNVMGI